MTYLIKPAVRSGGTSCDWSCVSCASAQHFTVSCLLASPARLWVLVWQSIAAYQTGQAQLLLCCVSMKYVLWGLLLDTDPTVSSHSLWYQVSLLPSKSYSSSFSLTVVSACLTSFCTYHLLCSSLTLLAQPCDLSWCETWCSSNVTFMIGEHEFVVDGMLTILAPCFKLTEKKSHRHTGQVEPGQQWDQTCRQKYWTMYLLLGLSQ